MKQHPNLEFVDVAALTPYPRNARKHSKRQIEQIAASMRRFGVLNPVLVDDNLQVIAGHGRVAAAKLVGLNKLPILRFSHLSEADKRAYILADNRLAELAEWDREVLALELQGLVELNYDCEPIGFETAEIDLLLGEVETDDSAQNAANDIPERAANTVTVLGDVWECGPHRIMCGDARDPSAYVLLMGGERAAMMFTDPPFNVAISGHVRAATAGHREFAMASGEMSSAEFEAFLSETLGPAAQTCRDGAIAFVCMDWRHMREVLAAGATVFSELKNLCVWAKTNGGMGSLYRSQHELVFVFKHGSAPHTNNVELGKFGRNRTNIWSYAGVNAFKKDRDEELAMHPTVKPVAMVEDAIKDVSARHDIVLDPFGGSGSTLIAAEKCGRRARLLELDPTYCDVIVRRYEAFTGKKARRTADGLCFSDASASQAA